MVEVLEPQCSSKRCRAPASWQLRWNNPKLHTPEYRKTWLACDDHRERLAEFLRRREAEAARRFPRDVALEPRFAQLLPEVLLGVTPEQFAALAHEALTPKPPPTVSVSHLHAPAVSVTEQLVLVRGRIATAGTATFRSLSSDCAHTLEVVARFLALLELYRQQLVTFDQVTPLGELHVRWTGPQLIGGRLPEEIEAAIADDLEDYE